MIRNASLAILIGLAATAARADPCEAIPEGSPLPTYLGFGSAFSGEVVQVIDGDDDGIACEPYRGR